MKPTSWLALVGGLTLTWSLGAVGATAQEEEVYKKITDVRLEKIFQGLGIPFRRTGLMRTEYHFAHKGFKMKLVNFNGGDLMLTATFRQASLEEINKYNLEHKHVRAVLYLTFSALEMNLDCAGGVSDSIVREFIRGFEPEARAFANYLAK